MRKIVGGLGVLCIVCAMPLALGGLARAYMAAQQGSWQATEAECGTADNLAGMEREAQDRCWRETYPPGPLDLSDGELWIAAGLAGIGLAGIGLGASSAPPWVVLAACFLGAVVAAAFFWNLSERHRLEDTYRTEMPGSYSPSPVPTRRP